VSLQTGRRVLEIEARALVEIAGRLDSDFDRAVDLIAGCEGRVILTGMGKSGIVAQKIAATLSSTGRPAYFMHPAEAVHGDLGMIVSGDLLLALSNSGETEEIVRLLEVVRRLGAKIVALSGAPQSTLARHADVHLDVGVSEEACSLDLVPTASTTAALAMGDALAVACYERSGFSAREFARFHPGGRLGRRLLQVRDLMHTGDGLPTVLESDDLHTAVEEVSGRRPQAAYVAPRDSAERHGVRSDEPRAVHDRTRRAGHRGIEDHGTEEDHLVARRLPGRRTLRRDPDPRSVAHRALLVSEPRLRAGGTS
jgi:arabinose-5-phosphate isomerase